MRKNHFVSFLLLAVLAACNNSTDKTAAAGTDSTAKGHDTTMSNMKPDSSQAMLEVPAGAKVFFKNLKDGQTVSSPVKVEMGVEGIQLDTAGVLKPGSGHHHILVDAGDSIPSGTVVTKDAQHLHFGKAQTEAEVPLTPGKHTLTLQYADGIHRSYGGRLAATVTITVK
jgi:hypothetical protein